MMARLSIVRSDPGSTYMMRNAGVPVAELRRIVAPFPRIVSLCALSGRIGGKPLSELSGVVNAARRETDHVITIV